MRVKSFLLLLGVLLCGTGIHAQDLVVVVSPRSGVAAMTRAEVINYFFGRNRQFFNGVEAEPVDLHDSNPMRERFYRQLVGKELAEVNAYWSRQLFSGRMQPLPRVASSDEVLKWVAAHPGGIGFVEAHKVDARARIVYEFKP